MLTYAHLCSRRDGEARSAQAVLKPFTDTHAKPFTDTHIRMRQHTLLLGRHT
jgi:hypothetical protein